MSIKHDQFRKHVTVGLSVVGFWVQTPAKPEIKRLCFFLREIFSKTYGNVFPVNDVTFQFIQRFIFFL